MILTEAQRDALSEIVNIGISKASKQLSILLKDRIEMNVPVVVVDDYGNLPDILDIRTDDEIVCVHQNATGFLTGRVMLLFHSDESRQLVQALVGAIPPMRGVDMRAFEYEALTEIGNIIVSATIASIADLLTSRIGLTIPVYAEGQFGDVSAEIFGPQTDAGGKILAMKTVMRAARRDITGTLVITFSFDRLNDLIRSIDEFLAKLNAN